MASPFSVRLAFMYFLSLPGFSYLCECVYDDGAEWMGREKCKWESCVLCAEGGFALLNIFCLSAAWLYVFINFPTLVLCRFCLTLLLLLLFLVYLLCPPSRTDGTILCFLFSCAPQLCWWVWKTFLSIFLKCVWVSHWACRKYNQFYFALTLIPFYCPLFFPRFSSDPH